MNLKRKIQNLFAALLFQRRPAYFVQSNFGQSAKRRLYWSKSFMLLFARRALLCCLLAVGMSSVVFGQTSYYATNGTEYPVAGSMLGDQVFPDAAVTPAGGFLVWQDNIMDGNGWGVSARRLDSTLSGTLGPFRVNQQGTND